VRDPNFAVTRRAQNDETYFGHFCTAPFNVSCTCTLPISTLATGGMGPIRFTFFIHFAALQSRPRLA
jgi:hypothetical protein